MPDRLSKALLERMTAPMFSVSTRSDLPGILCLTVWTHELGNTPVSFLLSKWDVQRLQDKLALANTAE